MQMALGAVYAWSVFRTPLVKQFHWTISQVTLTFTICIFVLGFAAFLGGLWLNKKGPRPVALTGGFLYGLGVFLASYSANNLHWLYLSYGVIGGIGLGFGYIVPIAVLVKWFPDKRGLITGVAVGGFGAGALVTAPVATRLIQSVGVLHTFAYLGVAYLIVTMIAGWFMQNPPAGYVPAGWTPSATQRIAAMRRGLHAGQRAGDVAMVGAVAGAVPEYNGRHFGDLAGIADVSGDCEGHGDRGGGAWWELRASATRWAASSGHGFPTGSRGAGRLW